MKSGVRMKLDLTKSRYMLLDNANDIVKSNEMKFYYADIDCQLTQIKIVLITVFLLLLLNYRNSEAIISAPHMVPKFVNFFSMLCFVSYMT